MMLYAGDGSATEIFSWASMLTKIAEKRAPAGISGTPGMSEILLVFLLLSFSPGTRRRCRSSRSPSSIVFLRCISKAIFMTDGGTDVGRLADMLFDRDL